MHEMVVWYFLSSSLGIIFVCNIMYLSRILFAVIANALIDNLLAFYIFFDLMFGIIDNSIDLYIILSPIILLHYGFIIIKIMFHYLIILLRSIFFGTHMWSDTCWEVFTLIDSYVYLFYIFLFYHLAANYVPYFSFEWITQRIHLI
jgi:hypothetical protein